MRRIAKYKARGTDGLGSEEMWNVERSTPMYKAAHLWQNTGFNALQALGHARITPLSKTKTAITPANKVRPIAVMPNQRKIFEATWMHLYESKLLTLMSASQAGSRPLSSTSVQITKLLQWISAPKDQRPKAILFVDFEKAYEKLSRPWIELSMRLWGELLDESYQQVVRWRTDGVT
jgi:hypothetical protein